MALYHRATITPTKAELLDDWVRTQPWGPHTSAAVDVIGAYRFDDPEGRVGMETFLVTGGDTLLHVPLTYRDEPLVDSGDALITEMHHSALGTRWVYDGLHDPRLVMMLAGAALTGQGEALGMVVDQGRWHIAPTNVRIQGGGWTQERVPVDGFQIELANESTVLFRNDRFELLVFRRPIPGGRPPIGLTATWEGLASPVVLAEVRPV